MRTRKTKGAKSKARLRRFIGKSKARRRRTSKARKVSVRRT